MSLQKCSVYLFVNVYQVLFNSEWYSFGNRPITFDFIGQKNVDKNIVTFLVRLERKKPRCYPKNSIDVSCGYLFVYLRSLLVRCARGAKDVTSLETSSGLSS